MIRVQMKLAMEHEPDPLLPLETPWNKRLAFQAVNGTPERSMEHVESIGTIGAEWNTTIEWNSHPDLAQNKFYVWLLTYTQISPIL
jgi:hypothetical protein